MSTIADSLRQVQEAINDFLVKPFDAEGRQQLKIERERLRVLHPRYDELLSHILPHPDCLRITRALRVLVGLDNLPSGSRQDPYWKRVAQMSRTLNNISPYTQQVQWLEEAIPMLEELLGEEHEKL